MWDEYLEKRQQKIRLKRQEKRQQKREEERKKKEEELAMKKLKKRNKKRNKRKDGQLSDDQDEDDGSGLSADQRAKRRAELELLTIDSNAKPKGLHDESVSAESTVKDPRFGALFTSHDFDLDPTHPRYPLFSLLICLFVCWFACLTQSYV